MTELISGELYIKMVSNAAAAIENHKAELNDLNVFPVPDGDTGTNMGLTMNSADKALAAMSPGTLGHTCEVAASALLRGARGNSGVILSLLFRGFSRHLKDMDTADSKQIAAAMAAGVESAYKAVMKPTEGTILTVSRLAAKAAVSAAETEGDIEKVLDSAIKSGAEALANTINLNPVLAKAGVIDAGGKGYMYMLDGMLRAIRGEMIEKAVAEAPADKADFTQYAAEDIKFAYCTEFLVERKAKNKDVNRLRDFLDKRGDSVVVVDDDEIIKIHVHTNEPGVVLTEALTFGPLHDIKIENMREQHSETLISTGSSAPAAAPVIEPEEMKPYAVVAVCAGSGIEEVFRNLGADRLVTGGQTMNPSTEDILNEVKSAPSDIVFILPNNKNIIMAAEQCEPLTDKRVIVIPTKSIPQGISALLTIDDAESIDDMQGVMTKAAKKANTALITLAARDSSFDGMDIKEGQYLALVNNSLEASGSSFQKVMTSVATTLGKSSPEFITIFIGEDAKEKQTASVLKMLETQSPDAEVSVIHGNQPVYNYIISAE
jgi:DAK2 domain fusion protein YloV